MKFLNMQHVQEQNVFPLPSKRESTSIYSTVLSKISSTDRVIVGSTAQLKGSSTAEVMVSSTAQVKRTFTVGGKVSSTTQVKVSSTAKVLSRTVLALSPQRLPVHSRHTATHGGSFGRSCKGAALLEFALLLGVLVPIALGMTMLAKLGDVKMNTQQASRYTLWEATVYSRDTLASVGSDKVEARFFEQPDAVIVSVANASANDSSNNNSTNNNGSSNNNDSQHHWWGKSATQTGLKDLATVARHDTPTATEYAFDTGKAPLGKGTGEVVAAAGSLLDGISGNSWGLVADGLLRSDVSVPLQSRGLLRPIAANCQASQASANQGGVNQGGANQSGANQSGANQSGANQSGANNNSANSANANAGGTAQLCMSSAGVILADGWGASGDQQSRERVRSLVPASALGIVGSGVGGLLGSTVFPELRPLRDSFGHVDMSVLPEYARPE